MRETLTHVLDTHYPRCGTGTQGQRFVVVGRSAAPGSPTMICDNRTGLHWERKPVVEGLTFLEAVAGCSRLNFGERTWRLATVQDYLSLVDYQERGPALPSGHVFDLGGLDADEFFWTGTPVAKWDGVQWVMNMGFGTPTWIFSDSDEQFRVWCVSGDSLLLSGE